MYVYETTNLVNGKKYIGVSVTKENSDNYLGSGVLLKRAIKKYSVESFIKIIIKEFESEKDARDYERNLIEKLNAINDENYYNLVAGGYGGGVRRHPVSDETKKKISDGNKGNKLTRKRILEMGKPTLKYSLDGNFINRYETKADAETDIKSKMTRLTFNKICKIKGFLWKYQVGEIEDKIISSNDLDNNKKNKLSKAFSKLSKDDVINLVKDKELGLTYKEISEKYGVTISCAYEIVIGKTYKWVWI